MNVPAALHDRGIRFLRTVPVWVAVLLSLVAFTAPADAAICTSGTSGNWSAITWDCGTPANGDDIVIATNVTLDLASFTANMLTVNTGVTFDIAGNAFTISNDLRGTGTVNFTTGKLFIGGDGGSCGECMEVALAGRPDVTYDGLVAQVLNKSSYSSLTFGPSNYHDYFRTYFTPTINIDAGVLLRDGAKLDLYDDSGLSEPVILDGRGAAPFEMQGTSELAVGGGSIAVAPFPRNFSPYTISPNSKVTYDALANQMISSAPVYGNLSVVLSAYTYLSHTPDGNLNLQGNLTVQDLNFFSASITLDMLTYNVAAGGDLLVEGQGAVFDGGNGSNTHTFGGDIQLSPGGTIIDPGTFILNGTVPQNIIGPISFTNLTLQNGATIDATSSVQISGALELGSNVLTVGGRTPLVLGASSSVNATTGYISGLVERQFDGSSIGVSKQIPVGAGGISAPVSIVVDSLTSTSGSFQVEGFATQHPSAPPGAASFYWQLTPTNIGQADVTFNYDPTTLPLPEADYRPARWNGTAWEVPPGATIDPTTNTATIINQTTFSPWTLIPSATCTVISSADSGTGTLREAINNLNSGTCGPTINFDISSFEGTGPHTITLSSSLPAITASSATIDGFTETGSIANSATIDQPVNASWQVIVDGPSVCAISPCAPSNVSALVVSSANVTVRGLVIQNSGTGIDLQGSGAAVAGNRLAGHYYDSIKITGSSNRVGGTDADRNVIHGGFQNYGVRIIGSTAANNVVEGNHIGFDQAGANDGTKLDGVLIDNAGTGNRIGTFGRGNVIGNSQGFSGVTVLGDGLGTTDNGFIEGNRIGTNLQGTAAAPNTNGFSAVGIYLESVDGFTITGNLLSGHAVGKTDAGIYLYDSSGTTIQNNKIGTDIAGTGAIPNNYGIVIDLGSMNNVIGESVAPNTIANNIFDGIAFYGGTGNLILENTIRDNGTDPLNDLPIDLMDDGPTANDPGDADNGPNELQNYPTLSNVVYDSLASTVTLDFSLDSGSTAAQSIRVDFYRSDASFGHMVEHLGSTCFVGASGGVTGFSMPSGGVGTGSYVTATANSYSDTACNTPLDGASETAPASVVNTAPVATADSYSTNEDTALAVAAPGVLGNDGDADADPLTAVLDTTVMNGTLTLNADGSFTYAPSANFNGTDSFSYHASDGTASSSIVTVTLNVTAVNDAPAAVADSYTGTEDTTLTVAAPGVLLNDSDVDGDPLTAVLNATATNGTLTLNADGSFSYAPSANFNGTDSFSYHANDGLADSNIVTVTLNVGAANDAPVAIGDSYSGTEDTVLSIAAPGVLGNDTDTEGDSLTAVLDATVTNGTLTLNADGSFTYTPSANFNGTDSFSYHASDGTASSSIVTVTLNVTAVNDAPVAVADSYTGTEDTTLTVAAPGVLFNDSDVDGDPLTAVLDATVTNGTLTLNADGSFSYGPSASFNGTDSFSYHANDGLADSNIVTVTLNIGAANDSPVAVDDSATTSEDTAVTVAVLSNDSDPDSDTLTVSTATNGAKGTVSCTVSDCTYTPSLNFNGSDSFTYTISDGKGGTATATVFVTVTAVNDPPVANPDSATTTFETPKSIAVLANDTDADGDALTVAAVGAPGNGNVTCTSGGCTYTPDAGFSGTDSFTYTVSDGNGGSDVGTVTVTVTSEITTDLEITKTGPVRHTRGEAVDFTITLKNLGSGDAFDVKVEDPTPTGLVHVFNTGDCTTDFPCLLGTMPAGSVKTIQARFVIDPAAPQTVTNTASVATSTTDTNTANNSASATVDVCPVAPESMNPANRATGVARSGQLSWSDAGATEYVVFLGPVGSGCSTQFGTSSTNSLVYSGLDPDTEYEWRVVATKAQCTQKFSECLTFTTGTGECVGEQAQLIEPAADSTLSNPVTFMWTAVDGATGYDVVVDQGSGPVVVASTTSTSATVSVSPGATTWYVDTHFDGCPSTRSAGSAFTVEGGDCIDDSPELFAPADGASGLSSPVEFRWSVVPGASSYRVWVESEDSFPVVVGTTSATTLVATVPSGELHWYVQALFEGCPPTISEVRTIEVQAGAGCPTDRAELISPQEGADLDSPILFEWSAVDGAVRYAVWASVGGDTESIIGTTEGEANTTLERTMDAGEIEWFVEVFFGGCPSIKTSSRSFTVNEDLACVTESPQLMLPGTEAVEVPGLVKFKWSSVPTATGYRLWAKTNGVGEFEQIGATLAETELQVPMRANMVTWYVEAVFDRCRPTRSSEQRFFIRSTQNCNASASELITPIGNVTLEKNRVNLVWTAVDGADAYNVWVSREDGGKSKVGLTSGSELSIEVDLEEGAHEWWVTALFGSCSPIDSEHELFKVDTGVPDECRSNSELLLLAPAEGAADIASPVIFEWSEVPDATGYQIWLLEGENDTPRPLGGIRESTQAVVQIPAGTIRWYVEAIRSGVCGPVRSAIQHFKVTPAERACDIPDKPLVYVPQNVSTGTTYRISWDQVPGATVYEVQESTSHSFRDLPVRVVRGTSTRYSHTVSSGSETFFYRVRAIGDCNGERSSYSPLAQVTVVGNANGGSASASRGYRLSAEDGLGSEMIELNKDAYSQNEIEEFTVVLRSPGAESETVRLIPDQSWMTVDPEVVTLTPAGVAVTIRAEMGDLPLGTSTATLRYEPVGGGKSSSQSGTSTVSVSLVTPVAQTGKNKPLPESLIIPAVAHADGLNSTWLSDIRLTNVGAVTQKYQLNFTPAGVDGTQTGQSTSLDVQPGSTVALNDVLANWYGTVSGDSKTGMLEIRPMKSSTSSSIGGLAAVASGGFTSLASSRTYNMTPNGTFGQFIPAIRFEKFVGTGTEESGIPRLSLQQVSQSSAFRTNLGIVEASGNAVDALVNVFDNAGSLVGSFTVAMQPGEHKQLNSVLEQQGITVENGRIEISAANGEGRLMAYGSVVDNITNDPQLVPAVTLGEDPGTKWVLPGVADLETGQASWRTDVRILNADGEPREVKLTYYPQNDPGVKREASLTLNAGEIEVLDDLLATFFGETNTGGVVHVETEATTNLVTTGRTYNREADGGTFGQFIPAVNASRAVGRGEQALQVMQVEQSDRFRANLGLAEVTGQPVQVEVSAVVPGAKTSVKAVVSLQGNEFTQLVGVLNSLGISEAYNARISVKVVNGGGRVVAYGSIVDNETQDPTYVPAQ